MINHEQKDDHLFQGYLEGRLTAEELADLDLRTREDETFRRDFSDWLHQDGVLKAEAHDLFSDSEEIDAERASAPSLVGRRILTAAALLAFGLALGWMLGPAFQKTEVVETSEVEEVATLADIKSAKWGASSLPTQEGARLSPGKLELLEGLASVRFDSGATVTLEAPATLEVESAMRCRLIDGAAVAWVPDGAEGFQIETADALLTDYGTRFGVTANSNGQSEVLVLEGEVGVTHSKGTEEKRLTTGEMVRYDAEALVDAVSNRGGETTRFKESADLKRDGWVSITTADGRGKDTYVRQGNGNAPFGVSPLIMVKNSVEAAGNRRKAWLSFDLAGMDRSALSDSELVLSIQPSGLGYASVVPDATFAVYGLRDESADFAWDEKTMLWELAPANVIDDGFGLVPEKTVLLGEFVVEQGVSSGMRKISGAAISDFILSDTNGLVTFIIVRLTDENDQHGLVHAFASAEHPAAMPPTLRLRIP